MFQPYMRGVGVAVLAALTMSMISASANADDSKDIMRDLMGGLVYVPKVMKMTPIKPPTNFPSTALEIFPLTQRDNPLISSQCRTKAYGVSKNNVDYKGRTYKQKLTMVGKMWQAHAEWMQSGQDPAKKPKMPMTYGMVVSEFEKCDVCGPIVNELLRCHTNAVKENKNSVHLVTFGIGQSRLSSNERSRLVEFIRRASPKRVFIEARASQLSDTESLTMNERLAEDRKNSVMDMLILAGLPRSEVKSKVVVWTPPRLDDRYIAASYGLEGKWDQLGNKKHLNQSVIITSF